MLKLLILFILFLPAMIAYAQKVTTSSKTLTTSSQVLLSENVTRRGWCVYAEGDSCYIKVSTTSADAATSSSYTVMLLKNDYYEQAGSYWNVTGILTGLCATGTKTVRITEYFY